MHVVRVDFKMLKFIWDRMTWYSLFQANIIYCAVAIVYCIISLFDFEETQKTHNDRDTAHEYACAHFVVEIDEKNQALMAGFNTI